MREQMILALRRLSERGRLARSRRASRPSTWRPGETPDRCGRGRPRSDYRSWITRPRYSVSSIGGATVTTNEPVAVLPALSLASNSRSSLPAPFGARASRPQSAGVSPGDMAVGRDARPLRTRTSALRLPILDCAAEVLRVIDRRSDGDDERAGRGIARFVTRRATHVRLSRRLSERGRLARSRRASRPATWRSGETPDRCGRGRPRSDLPVLDHAAEVL